MMMMIMIIINYYRVRARMVSYVGGNVTIRLHK